CVTASSTTVRDAKRSSPAAAMRAPSRPRRSSASPKRISNTCWSISCAIRAIGADANSRRRPRVSCRSKHAVLREPPMLPAKPDFLVISEVDHPEAMVGDLFQRKFGHPLPEWKHDVVAFFRKDDGTLVPMSYTKFAVLEPLILVGGCCTDGRAFAHMSEAQKAQLTAAGGSMAQLL